MLETPDQDESNLIDAKEFGKRFTEWSKKHGEELLEIQKMAEENELSWGWCVEDIAQRYPDNIAVKFEDITLTYKEFNEKVNQYANYFISLGLKKGDIVKIFIKNRIEFLFIYTANAKIGAINSLINTDIVRKP